MRLPVLLVCTVALGGCSVDMGGFAFQSEKKGAVTTTTTRSVSAGVSTREPVLTPEGACSVGASLDPSTRPLPREIAPGITECELVKIKGKPPTDVLVGESGKGQREVQVLYSEPGGRELYLFTDNRLGRIVKPGGTDVSGQGPSTAPPSASPPSVPPPLAQTPSTPS
ncbi:hypothetical protein [Bosea sp. (in: a-proteobacteria)]|uniref:hypothetical protein n=1 Tax=Bosea sp. (in: a-proteobacteria) TaxID=1871050 RepID=UPI0011F4D988|nr:hypothetical protein [Bosea sp. (in: a-proteobacteria)]TAJ33691.1 MAG: hypothetical protein EPO59_04120 [Bosea sp. (in: a-proteobacteria)]